MEFTQEQLQAIESRNENLLVSAAAGSGKTAVLVERIIRRVLDEESPVDIDRFLVMTFTKAAAEQMKEKILKAIEDERSKNPTDKHLIKQAALVHNARITTIHGFCLDVIRNHFQEIGLDPDFRVADEGECRLLKADVIEKVIEKAYEEGSDDFINMVECLSAGKSDSGLEGILDKMYEFSMSDPEPEKWLDRCVKAYTDEGKEERVWVDVFLGQAGMLLADAHDKAARAQEITREPDGPYMYEPAASNDLELIEALKECRGYDELRGSLAGAEFVRLKNKPKDGPYVDEDLKGKFMALRESVKDVVKELKKDFSLPLEEQDRRIGACLGVVRELTRLTGCIINEYSALKRDKNIVDFADIEHLCIRILGADDGITAAEYRDYFEEIYVDEYQDSNLVQEELLSLIARDDNLFMVGDVKQSIYSFRLARPTLFTAKYETYSRTAADGGTVHSNRKIDLTRNFRSRRSVLDSVNELFEQIMHRELSEIEYDDAARLNYGAAYPETEEKLEKTELILTAGDENINRRELEARVIASRIKTLMKEQTVADPTEEDPARKRPVRYSDIVILLRTAKGWDETFKKVISGAGIPVHTMSSEGYFAAMEVSVLLDYLSVLDNPLQDIKLAAVLRSYFGGFLNEDLAKLKTGYKGTYLYDSLCRCKEDETSGLHDKVSAFLDEYNRLRSKTGYTPVYELLLEIIEGGYGLSVAALDGGRKKSANLNMLLKKAEDYGKTSYKGLFHFVRYIEMLKKYEVDYGEANTLDENDDTVRIMTIHKSKGLEFPVCFLAGLQKNYNKMDLTGTVVPDIDLGLGIELVDPVLRIRQTTAMKRAAVIRKTRELLAEEERVLYVAMTRAKEKLILTGVVKDIDKALASDKGLIKCSCYLDLITYGLANAGLPSITVNTLSAAGLVNEEIRESVEREAEREELLRRLEGQGNTSDIVKERFSFVYPYKDAGKAFEKISVTELKKRSMQEQTGTDKEMPDTAKELYKEERAVPYVPDFIKESEEEISATLHGTAVHRIFEIWDYSKGTTDKDIEEFIKYVKREGLMEESLADCVKIHEISGFVNSPLAGRMKRADERGLLYREQPFMFSHDGIIIQGIIDAYFIEDDKIVIVDYKTDRADDIKDLADRYHVQLEYYAMALKTMLDKEIGDLIIYSSRYKDIVSIPTAVVN